MKNLFIFALSGFLLAASAQDSQVITARRRVTGPPVVTLSTSNGVSSATNVTLTGGNAGDLIVCGIQTDTFSGTTMSDGTSTLTALTQFNSGSAPGMQFFYLLSANGPNKTYTAGVSGEVECFDFHTTSGTWHFDAQHLNGAGGSSSATTGNITTTQTAEAVVFCNKLKSIAATTSSPTINGVTPSEPGWSPLGTFDHQYYRIVTSTFTGQGALTYSTNTNWVAGIAAFYAQ